MPRQDPARANDPERLDQALRVLFRTVERASVPALLLWTVDQLETAAPGRESVET